MSGHSKWSTIKRQKGVTDAKRGQLFTKLARELSLAVRQGGGNPESNVRLRLAIQKAKDNNMPADNIERAIKRASGGGDGASEMAEVIYEGYGPGGSAILVEVATTNRNRTISDVRSAFTRHGGSLGESGCVAWLFDSRGVITVEASQDKAEEAGLIAIDAGADDVKVEGNVTEVYTRPEMLDKVRKALEAQGFKTQGVEISWVPKTTMPLEHQAAEATLRLLDHLEELDDVQKVYTNADFPEAVLERYRASAA
jgi:YebC/PmpR family DNA-binding regulatory protein